MILVFLLIARIIECANLYTDVLANNNFTRLVVEKISMSRHVVENKWMKSERIGLIFR